MGYYRDELEALAQGLDVNRYYDAWRLVLLLWRGLWYDATTDWSRYRTRIWGMFTERVQSAAMTSGDLDAFLSRVARLLSLRSLGLNEDDRQELARLLALPNAEKRAIMRQLREDTPVLVALVRRWRDVSKEARDLERKFEEEPTILEDGNGTGDH